MNQDDVVVAQGLLELWAVNDVEVALAPCRSVICMIDHDSLQLGVVMTEVHDHLRQAGLADS